MRSFRQILLLLIFLIVLTGTRGYSQRIALLNMPRYDLDRFHFGFVLGIDQSLVTLRPIPDLATRIFDSTYLPDILPLPDSARLMTVESMASPGFVISIVSNMRIGDHFDLRFIPSLAFGDRDLLYTIETYKNGDTTIENIKKRVPSTYINFPIEIRYKAKRYNNFRPYLMTGVQYTLDLASQAKKREKKNSDQKIVKFNASDVYVEAGVGFDFYNEWFKFGVEIKMMYGLLDVLKREGNIYTDGISSLKSKVFQVSFTFE